MNTLCNAVKFPVMGSMPSLNDTLELVRTVVLAALLSTLESRLGFPVQPLLDGIGQVWLNRIAQIAKAITPHFLRHFISSTR